MIVDDESAQMRALCDTLTDEGYVTQGFSSGQDALQALRPGEFDLLLTDLVMLEMDGITLIKSVLAADSDIGIIVMTGHGTIDTAVRAMQGGALDYISKPFSLNTILAVITRALNIRALRRENARLHADALIARAMRDASNRERRNLAQEVHDGLGQVLTGMSLMLAAFTASEKQAGRPANECLSQMEKLHRRAIATCHDIAHGLSPVGYAGGGLVNALEEMVTRLRGSAEPTVRFAAIKAAALNLDFDAQDHLYRIVQEAVTNAQRHAQAKTIQVTLDIQPATVRLEIEDDGIGVDTGQHFEGIGLRGMQYRADSIGAQVWVTPRNPRGTRVMCRCTNAGADSGVNREH
jgi:signal transduction histidine kinase